MKPKQKEIEQPPATDELIKDAKRIRDFWVAGSNYWIKADRILQYLKTKLQPPATDDRLKLESITLTRTPKEQAEIESGIHATDDKGIPKFMKKDRPTIAGERTQQQALHNGKTAKEWFELHEEIRQDYSRAIAELESQDKEIKKHEEADKQRKHGVKQ